jgi:hypothetical protein
VDDADLTPPAGVVGNTLRATGHAVDTVDFQWPLAPPPAPGEAYAILRSDDRPNGVFDLQDTTPTPSWTDPAAPPPRWIPAHVWFYDVRLVDGCGNVSSD